jgi:hypothetical protein
MKKMVNQRSVLGIVFWLVAFSTLEILSETKNKYYQVQPAVNSLSFSRTPLTSSASQSTDFPFEFPLEAKLLSHYISPNDMAKFSSNKPALNSTISKSHYNIFINDTTTSSLELLVYELSPAVTPISNQLRDTNSRMPSLWQSSASPRVNTTSGLALSYLKKDFGINLDFNFRLAGNQAGSAFLESVTSNLSMSYKMKNLGLNDLDKVNMILQVSNVQNLDDKLIIRRNDVQKLFQKNAFITPGFTFAMKTFMLEGMIRMPVSTLGQSEDHWKSSDIQGRLGMKWYLPEYIKP